MVIGLMAGILGVSAEALTIVVLAHELAHAYTHLGSDIDGQRWKVGDFARADLRIVEGLAQFYAEEVCNRLESRVPAASEAYKRLLEHQSCPYRAHEAWRSSGKAAGEVVRVSMIECRSQGFLKYDQFEEALKRHRQALR